MERRAILRALGLAGAVPWIPRAEASAKARRVGMLMSTTPTAAAHIVVAFAAALHELGYVEGKDVVFEYRWAEGRSERFSALAADLVQAKVDVIVASSQGAALAAMRATRTIPIVMVNTTDPVEAGLVASLARPGGNVTGSSQQLSPEIRAKQLQLFREALPRLSRVSVLWSSTTTVGLAEYQAAGKILGVGVTLWEVQGAEGLERVFAALVRDRAEGILLPGDTGLFIERKRIVALAARHRLPAMYSNREFVEAGGLMSYSAPLTAQFQRAAAYVDRILRGAAPGALPVESPTEYELALNLKAAAALGLVFPPLLLVRAKEVIR